MLDEDFRCGCETDPNDAPLSALVSMCGPQTKRKVLWPVGVNSYAGREHQLSFLPSRQSWTAGAGQLAALSIHMHRRVTI